MKLCKVTDLKGGEVLAKTIITPEFKVLLSDGIVLRPEYIDKIVSLGISEVYIQEEKNESDEVVLLRTELKKELHDRVKNILEKHTYTKNKNLEGLTEAAESIISNVLEEEKLVHKIYDIKERSADIYEHSVTICSLATLVALKLHLDQKRIHDIAVGCLLHDLGLRYLTIDYIGRDLSSMSQPEKIEYMKHPVYGYTALKNENWISDLGKQIILNHHEVMDGSGYPLKLKKIPEEAKIVGICDVFDEMICGIGNTRQKVYQAVEYLKVFEGIKYDKEMVETLLEFTAVYPVGSEVILNNEIRAMVMHQNKEFPDRPVIQVISDESGDYRKGQMVDLLEANHLFVEKVLE